MSEATPLARHPDMVMDSLGLGLSERIASHPDSLQKIAARWLGACECGPLRERELWSELLREPPSERSATAHLERLARGSLIGVWFFFRHRELGEFLLESLDVPTAERAQVLDRAAEVLLSPSYAVEPPVEVVVDLSSFHASPARRAALFGAIECDVLDVWSGRVALVTGVEAQDMPWRIDSRQQPPVVFPIPRAGSAEDVVNALAGEHALVISARGFAAFDRWLAADFEGGRLLFDPVDGLDSFRLNGHLDALPRPNETLGVELAADGHRGDPPRGRARRRVMKTLLDEDAAHELGPPPTRAALAQSLGIDATMTRCERIDAAARRIEDGLRVHVQQGDIQALERQIRRSQRRTAHPCCAVRVDDVIHIINPSAGAAPVLLNRPFVRVHEVVHQPNEMSRLLAKLDSFTVDDYAMDPFLIELLDELASDATERIALAHARLCLHVANAFPVAPSLLVDDWRSAMDALLGDTVPRAALCLGASASRFIAPAPYPSDWFEAHAALETAPFGPVVVTREQALVVVHNQNAWGDPDSASSLHHRWPARGTKQSRTFLPSDADTARNADRWLDYFEHSRSEGGGFETCDFTPGAEERVVALAEGPRAAAPFVITCWRDVDRELAFAWQILKDALRAPDGAITLPGGAVLLPVGGGLFAELAIRVHTGCPRWRAALEQPICIERAWDGRSSQQAETVVLGERLARATTLVAETRDHGMARTEIGPLVPRCLRLAAAGRRATVRFHASPLHAARHRRLGHAAALAAADSEALDATQTEDLEDEHWDDDDD